MADGSKPEVCPSCGFDGRQANEYRKGELWSTCHDPWHSQEVDVLASPPIIPGETEGIWHPHPPWFAKVRDHRSRRRDAADFGSTSQSPTSSSQIGSTDD